MRCVCRVDAGLCLVAQQDNTFTDSYISTIGVDFKIAHLDWNDQKYKLQIVSRASAAFVA